MAFKTALNRQAFREILNLPCEWTFGADSFLGYLGARLFCVNGYVGLPPPNKASTDEVSEQDNDAGLSEHNNESLGRGCSEKSGT